MKSRVNKIISFLLTVTMLLGLNVFGIGKVAAATTADIEVETPTGTSTSPYNVNLTAGDYDDWAHFGNTTAASVNRKAGVTDRLIGSLSLVGTGSLQEASTDDVTNHRMQFTWTDGTPTASATSKYFVKNGAEGIKLNFILPAGAYQIKMFANVYNEKADVVITNSTGVEIGRQALIPGSIETWAHMAREITIDYESDVAQTINVSIARTEFDSSIWPGLSVAAAAVKAIDKEPEQPVTVFSVSTAASPSTGGSVTGSGAYEKGATVNMTATASAGYLFKEWQVISGGLVLADKTAANFSFVMPESNVDLRAVFARPDGELEDLTQYIYMTLGTSGASNTLIGTQRPNSSVSPGPDTNPQNSCTGYNPSGQIRGFSQIHVSGTGVGKYGQFLVSPQTGLATRLDGHDSAKANETPTCAEYSVDLTRYGITASFTPAEHSSIYKFVYPQNNNSSVLIDVAANIANANATSVRVNTGVNDKGEPFISGSGNYSGGWGKAHDLYFYAVLQKTNATLGLYNASGPISGTSMGPVSVSDRAAGMGAYATFATTANEVVYLKIATSFKSIDQAKTWLDLEIPAWDYSGVRDETERLWNEELNKIIIDGNISETNKRIFYTAVYHAHIMPRDRTGDFAKFGESDMIDEHFATWDTWRTLYPLYSITNPDIVAKTVNSFITRYNINKYVRDSFVAGIDMSEQQGGDNIDCVVSDAYVKGIGGVDWEEAYKVVKNNADNYRLSWPGWGDANLTPNVNSQYKVLGYIPVGGNATMSNCSYTLEYAYNDYCAAQIAKGLGKTEDYEKYLARSNNWTNLWNPDLDNNGYSGYIAPRENNFGAFVNINPTQSWGSWVDYFYEASAWNYSFFVPHDVNQLIEKMGGSETFTDRLKLGVDRNWVDMGNEPAFLAAALFNHTEKPWLTSDCMTNIRTRFSLTGVPGNDDSGAMSSWYIFSTTGLFPNAGQNIYYITSPIYDSTTYNLDNGKQFTIIANNLSTTNKYIQSVTINGKPYYKAWFGHEVIVEGSTIVYEMGPNPVNYAKAPANTVKLGEAKAEDSFNVNLSDPKFSEWAHFGSGNRKAGVANPIIGEVTPAQNTSTLSSGGFSWTDGTPMPTGNSVRSYAESPSGWLRLSVSIPVGSTDITLYYLNTYGLSVSNEAGDEVLLEVPGGGSGVAKTVTLSFDCEEAEDFTIALLDTTPAMIGTNIVAAAVQYFASYTVRFNSNGAGDVSSQIVRDGGKAEKPADLTRLGYVFGGWYKESALTNEWDFDTDVVTDDITLYAKWVPLFTVSFVSNGGSAVASQIKPQGSLLDAVQSTRTGYSFEGWFTNAGLTGVAWNFATDVVTAAITLYAKWDKLPQARIVGVAPITEAADINLSQYDDWAAVMPSMIESVMTAHKNISDTMIGNIGDLGEMGGSISGSPISFSWDDGFPLSAASSMKYAVSNAMGLDLKFSVPAGGYSASIYVTGVQTSGVVQILDEDGVIVDTKTLWPNAQSTRQYAVVNVEFFCDQSQEFTLRALVGDGAQVEGLSIGIFAATVTQEAPGVTIISDGNGSVSGGGIYDPGNTVTVTATPDAGYIFKGWQVISGGVTVPNTATVSFTMPDKSVTLRAIFEEQYVWVRSNDVLANLSRNTLSQPQYTDWAYLGYNSGRIMMADAETRVFTSNVSAVSGNLTQEDMQQYNSGTSPYFSWTGGTPTATGTDIRYILWNNTGLRLNVAVPRGIYEVSLYISGVRAGAELEVLDSGNNVVLTYHLWDFSGETRVYRKLNIDFDCKQAQTFTIRLLVSDPGPANYSVSIFAGVAEKLGSYYSVTAAASAGGTVSGGGDYASGREAALTAIPDSGFAFEGWYEGDTKVSGDAEYKFTVSRDISLTAKFIHAVTSVSISGSGSAITVKYDVLNESGGKLETLCILAVYDQSGRLYSYEMYELSVPGDFGNYELSATVNAGFMAKAFIWSDTYIPLCAEAVWK
ncbi:MAG: GH92 family glycosyl hydrolase [Oscillospiraceae bacterium]|nr:GH92 family glycosyl hydrolase [Oscillospiraceae bacterium]